MNNILKAAFKIALSISLLISFSLWSCVKTNDDPIGIKGNLSGVVNLYDDGVSPLAKEGMVVTLIGTDPLISDTTDIQGKFEFKDLAYGTYFLTFSKPTYGFTMINNVYHINKETKLNEQLSFGQISTTEITEIQAKDTLGSIYIYSKTNPVGSQQEPRYIRIFFHHSDAVNHQNFEHYSQVVKAVGDPANYRLNPHTLEDMGFKTGDKVWIKVYGDSYNSNAYIEPIKEQHIFPNLNMNSASAISFIAP